MCKLIHFVLSDTVDEEDAGDLDPEWATEFVYWMNCLCFIMF